MNTHTQPIAKRRNLAALCAAVLGTAIGGSGREPDSWSFPLAFQRDMQVVVGLGIIWFELERALEGLNRRREISLLTERDPEIIVRLGVVRIELDRLFIISNRFR